MDNQSSDLLANTWDRKLVVLQLRVPNLESLIKTTRFITGALKDQFLALQSNDVAFYQHGAVLTQ